MPGPVDPFAGSRTLRFANSPLKVLTRPPRSGLPLFWVMAGDGVQTDMVQAQAFVDLVGQYQRGVPFLVIKGGQHNYVAWREAFPRMFEWASSRLGG
jgi:S-formylglutathione hydrolase FrmB